jgi:predicted DNA-binding transcriptional regulator AlpA
MSMELRQLDPMPLARPPQALVALLTLDQVATMLGTSKAWVRDHATRRNPRIPVVRFGGKRAVLRFRPQDIENFITAHLQVQQGGV